MILLDSREQAPLWYPPISKKMKLDVGDYTTEKLLNIAHAERKSGSDLCGTLTFGHDRFKRMILRAQEKNIRLAIFVECSEKTFLSGQFEGAKHVKMSFVTLHKIANTISTKYNIPLFWCDGREDMKNKMSLWLVNEQDRAYMENPVEAMFR